MINLKSEIKNHILTHDFVMLPGIGSFLTEYTQPYLNSNGDIVPPKKQIRFNSLLKDDDDTSILSILKDKMGLDNTQIQDLYFRLYEDYNHQINNLNRYYWEGLGLVVRNTNGKVDFIAENEEEYIFTNTPVVLPIELEEETTPLIELKKERSSLSSIFIFVIPLIALTATLIYAVFIKPNKGKPDFDVSKITSIFNQDDEIQEDTLSFQQQVEYLPADRDYIVLIGHYKEKEAEEMALFLEKNNYPVRKRSYGKFFKVYLVADSQIKAEQFIKELTPILPDTLKLEE